MQQTKEEIEAILVSMGLVNIAFNLPIKNQIDSIDLTALVIAVEDEWKIDITDADRYELATFDDLIKLIHLKLKQMEKPTIDEQIRYMEVLEAVGHKPEMILAIKENLIAVKMIEYTRHDHITRPHAQYPLPETETSKLISDVEPPFMHPSGHSFTEGHDL